MPIWMRSLVALAGFAVPPRSPRPQHQRKRNTTATTPAIEAVAPDQPALSRTPARRNFWGSTASPSILVS